MVTPPPLTAGFRCLVRPEQAGGQEAGGQAAHGAPAVPVAETQGRGGEETPSKERGQDLCRSVQDAERMVRCVRV